MDGPYKSQKIGKVVRKKRGRILIRAKSLSSSVSVARAATIDILLDDVLLQIFDLCRESHNHLGMEWCRFTHVCRRWRQIIFSSPRRLDLYLLCRRGTPVRKNLGLWPAFPIILDYGSHFDYYYQRISLHDEDNIIAALEHPDRVRSLKVPVTSLLLKKLATVVQEQFPILTQLHLSSHGDEIASALPRGFLGGSTPLLQQIHLDGIPFPKLPTVLSSATDLVTLNLFRIPHTGYISPGALVAGLAALNRLDVLSIGFRSWTSRPNQSGTRRSKRRKAVALTRVVLPVLTSFEFRGASEYLEDLVARIDAPRLDNIGITYFNQLVFQVPKLFRFVGQTEILEQTRTMDADIYIDDNQVHLYFYPGQAESRRHLLDLRILCQGLDWQVSHLAEVLSQSSAVLSNVGHLSIGGESDLQPSWQDDMDHIEWLELLLPFTAVETLRVSALLAGHVADALTEVTAEMVPEILPALRLLYLKWEPVERVEEFITARQISDLPIAFVNDPNVFYGRRE